MRVNTDYLNFKNVKSYIVFSFYYLIIIIVALLVLSGPFLFFTASPSEVEALFGQGYAFYILSLLLIIFIFYYGIKIDANGEKINRKYIFTLSFFYDGLDVKLLNCVQKNLIEYMLEHNKEYTISKNKVISLISVPAMINAYYSNGEFRCPDIPDNFYSINAKFQYLRGLNFSSYKKYLFPMEKKIIEHVYLQLNENWITYLQDFNTENYKKYLNQQ